jgi:hypothetical protein
MGTTMIGNIKAWSGSASASDLASKRVASAFGRTVIASGRQYRDAFNSRCPGYRGGLAHFGLEVEDMETVFASIKEKYPSVGIVKRPPIDLLRTTAHTIPQETFST